MDDPIADCITNAIADYLADTKNETVKGTCNAGDIAVAYDIAFDEAPIYRVPGYDSTPQPVRDAIRVLLSSTEFREHAYRYLHTKLAESLSPTKTRA
jgi:hypothetical protein